MLSHCQHSPSLSDKDVLVLAPNRDSPPDLCCPGRIQHSPAVCGAWQAGNNQPIALGDGDPKTDLRAGEWVQVRLSGGGGGGFRVCVIIYWSFTPG